MYIINPYAQAGWYNPENQYSIKNDAWGPLSPPRPSIFGALPYGAPTCSTTLYTFLFTSFQPDILTCDILGPIIGNRPYFYVVNDKPKPGVTLFQSTSPRHCHHTKGFAIIDWRQQSTTVEIYDIVSRQPVNQWLQLSQDRSYRMMEVRGKQYHWVTNFKGQVCLYSCGGPHQPELLAKITRQLQAGKLSVVVDVSATTMKIGLWEVCIVGVVLLQCGRNID